MDMVNESDPKASPGAVDASEPRADADAPEAPEKTAVPEDNASQAADSPPEAKESDPEDKAQPDIPLELPVLPVRDIVVFNYMILPLFVGREKSVQAVDAALNGSRYILILTQKDEKVDEPGVDDLYRVGTVGMASTSPSHKNTRRWRRQWTAAQSRSASKAASSFKPYGLSR